MAESDRKHEERKQIVARIRGIAARLEGTSVNGDDIDHRIPRLDWAELRNKDFNYDWLVENWWPEASQMHVFASAKTGKSLLSLWIAANLAIGRDPFSWEPTKRQHIVYIDYEMTDKDLADRLNDMGFDFGELAGWLHYILCPPIAPMDTPSGGRELIELVKAYEAKVVIIDTLSRVIKGEENSNDTYRNFYNHTGQYLRTEGIALLRLDHAGHNPAKSRGASSKADDVDLVYSLERRSNSDDSPGYRLNRTHARVGNVSESIELVMNDEPLTIKSTAMRTYPAAVLTKLRQLTEANVPLDASRRDAIGLLKAAGFPVGTTTTLVEAMKLRVSREDFRQFGI